jgi:hypothetical protein
MDRAGLEDARFGGIGCRCRAGGLRFGADPPDDGSAPKDRKSLPAPVDAMVNDSSVLEIHELRKIELVAVGGRPWILPGEGSPVEEVSPGAMAARQFRRRSLRCPQEERPQVFAALNVP